MNYKRILEELRVLIILVVIAFTIKATLIEIYVVPTGSMEKTILTGDMLIGNKFIYGMRTPVWIGLPYSRIGFDIPWFRLPAFKEVEVGDVTIFEFPRDPFQKYVKRCIGIAGDSIFIDLGKIYINNKEYPLPINGQFTKGIVSPDQIEKIYSSLKGNKDNISEFVVPYPDMKINVNNISDWQSFVTLLVQDGNKVKFNNRVFTMIDPQEVARTHGFLKYKFLRMINNDDRKSAFYEREAKEKFLYNLYKEYSNKGLINPWNINYAGYENDYLLANITVNGIPLKEISEYSVKLKYYFFMGDNRDNSYDSRYWGFVPETQILGTPLFAVVNIFKFLLRLTVIS